jgi:hypothetical protein
MQKIIIGLIIVFFWSGCYSLNKETLKKQTHHEGYVILGNKTFQNIDSNGLGINEYKGDDMILKSALHKMYLKNSFLIETISTDNFQDGIYKFTDTTGYFFYDLKKQKFIKFDKLSVNAKVQKKGLMTDPGGSFSNTIKYDPMNNVEDSLWYLKDTVIGGENNRIVEFKKLEESDSMLTKAIKFWIKPRFVNFPLQISYLLSKKINNEFVCKMQLPLYDGERVMVSSLEFKPVKLPDSLNTIFSKWAEIIRKDE